MQANKMHLELIASKLGISFRGSPKTQDLLDAINNELDQLHASIACILPEPRRFDATTVGCQKRIHAFHKMARQRKEP